MAVINANDIYDKGKFSFYHFKLLFWCFMIILFDGYDTAIYGAVIPLLMEEWSLTTVQAGAIGSYTVIGTVVGAIGLSIIADKIGPKKVAIASVAIFSLFTFLAGFATGPVMFAVLRIIAGLGLGGVMPNIIALSTEFSPKKIRSTVVGVVFCGYAFGSMSVALISKVVIEPFGWQPMFWLAAVPLLLIPFMLKGIPESLRIHAKKGEDHKIYEILKKAIPEIKIAPSTVFERPRTGKQKKVSMGALMGEKRGVSTVMFWIASFSCFLLIYAMNTWLTKLMIQVGYDLSSSLMFLALLNVGAIIATIVGGPFMDKLGSRKVLVPLFLAGSIALTLIAKTDNLLVAYLLVGIIGAGCMGIHNLLNPVVAQFYPPEIRSTAIGIMMAFGRLGGIMSPTLVGILMSYNLSVDLNFTVIAVAGIIGAIAIFFVQEKHSYQYRNGPIFETGGNKESVNAKNKLSENTIQG